MGKKKYIKNSKGVTMSVTTDTLGLEKPLLNENYDIDVHNRNMDKIDEDLKPIDDSYIIELFRHDGDTTNPKDYYTKSEIDKKVETIENTVNENKTSILNNTNLANQALNKANEAFLRGDNVKTQLVDKLISEGLDVSTNNTFEELIGNIALGKKWASGVATPKGQTSFKGLGAYNETHYYIEVNNLDFEPSIFATYEINNNGGSFTTKDFIYSNGRQVCTVFKGNPISVDGTLAYLKLGAIKLPVGSYNGNNYCWIAFE